MAGAHGVPGGARPCAARRGAAAARLARPPQRALRLDVRGSLPRPARPHGGQRLRRVRPVVPLVDSGEAGRCRTWARAMKAAVVGGGLAGLAAALDLVDADVDVTLYEARPTLGGAVQTLPARDGDPEPPPDNGPHIALRCFTEDLGFLDRGGETGSLLPKRLPPPGIAEDGAVSSRTPTGLLLYRPRPLR